ncbi:proteasome assembly chaperone family protein [Haloarchaeobius litoreus]|uniref:Proteasome assembly chaperone family protein n=1 Tax=Haloarchaeobius litoreus TaxID=755306 RepID=A0ABD6DP68_9EURY|nr:PAC2 family protein [Haloarchaeobius litoreus]
MTQDTPTATFRRFTDVQADEPYLIEGLPGHGLVASIATDLVTRQLELEHHGSIVSDEFPSVAPFKDGRVQDLVRVYAGEEPPVLTLQSDVPLPGRAFEPLANCVLEDLAAEFEFAIFLTGAPAGSEEEIGEVFGVATTDEVEAELREADIRIADGFGLIGGVTGALVSACNQAGVPASVLVVKANPYLPDPTAAQSVIENALEPLVDFDIDTTELEEQADEIRKQMEEISKHYQQMMASEGQDPPEEPSGPTMFQ